MCLSRARWCFIAALAGLSLHANASLIDPAELKVGDLHWLQLRETTGLSLNDFRNGIGGWDTRYRFATRAEVESLLAELGVAAGLTDYAVSNPGATNFIFSLGGPFGTGSDIANPVAAGRGIEHYVYAQWTDGENGMPLSAVCPAYTSCGMSLAVDAVQDADERMAYAGLFLVRRATDLPEPSTLMLMGAAGAALAARRRKARTC